MEGILQLLENYSIAQQAQKAAWDLVLSRYISAAALTWLLYDHVLTFEDERVWIWSNKLTLIKVLFLINRYSAPLVILADVIQFSGRVTLSGDICRVWLFLSALWQSCSALIAQFLLGIRMCAIWGSRAWTKGVLYSGCAICTAASLTSITIALAQISPTYQYLPAFGICYTMKPLPSWLWAAFFLPIMVFDVLIFILTVWNAAVGRFEHIRKDSLTFMMWRDGAIYFALVFASELACVIISAVWGFGTTMIIKFLVWALQNVIIGHMTLNLVEAVRGPELEMMPTSFLDISERDIPKHPSPSAHKRSRKSRIWESTIDINGTASSPITFVRSIPSYQRDEGTTQIVYHENEWTQDPQRKGSITIDYYWDELSTRWTDMTREDPHWSEVYSSGKDERTHALAGSSRRINALKSQKQHPEVDDAVVPIGTGRSRLLMSAERRPSILTKEDLDELMGNRENKQEHREHSRYALWGTEMLPFEQTASLAVGSGEDYHPAGVETPEPPRGESASQRKKRLDQLVIALTTPPKPSLPISPRKLGFI